MGSVRSTELRDASVVAMVFQIAGNPVFARPLVYGLINAPYFLIASPVTR